VLERHGGERTSDRWKRLGHRWERLSHSWKRVSHRWERLGHGRKRVGRRWERLGGRGERERLRRGTCTCTTRNLSGSRSCHRSDGGHRRALRTHWRHGCDRAGGKH
jgi:hypothetical protein